jgi:peptidoglycan/xylan/chitin deacetylase (PgdA/CDA1 family)
VTVAVVVVADGRARPLVRTIDSIVRQSHAAGAAAIAAPPAMPAAILASLAERTGAIVTDDDVMAHAVNRAVAATQAPIVMLLPSGYRLTPHAVEWAATAFAAADVDVAACATREETPDGARGRVRPPGDFEMASLFEDVTAIPSLLCVRRHAWDAAGGFDSAAGTLVVADFLVRVLQAHPRSANIQDVFAVCDIPDVRGWHRIWPGGGDYLQHLEAFLARHRQVLNSVMREVLMRREIGYGSRRDRHRVLVDRRDSDLATLDRLRADAAHARAYLRHHGEGSIDWGDFRRSDPISRNWGYERGVPVDRYYIETFLAAHSSDIRGAVLEVQENDYTTTFGGSRVASSSVVDLDESNARATHLADLRCAPHMPSDAFDCIILTQTLHVIDDVGAVLSECRRLLKPDGVILATLPCASRVCLEYGPAGDLWRMTPAGGRALFEKTFGAGAVEATTYGNVQTNVAFLEGLACSDLTPQEFDAVDPYFPAVVGIRARKRSSFRASRTLGRAILLYHRVADDDDVHGLAISRRQFEEHVSMLARDCRVLPLGELLETPDDDLPPRAVALTFDDGYLDNLEEAAPALERAGLPATFFLTSGWLDGPGEYWWDTLERVLLLNESLPPSIELPVAKTLRLTTGTPEERRASHDQLHASMVQATLESRDRVIAELRRLGGLSGPSSPRRPLVADEVRRLARIPGMSVGAHTVNHLSLPHQDLAVVERELEDCKATLEDLTGKTIDAFAYPYGAVSGECADPVRRRFQWGLTCDEAEIGPSFDAARAGRIEVRNWTVEQLSERLDRVFAASAR